MYKLQGGTNVVFVWKALLTILLLMVFLFIVSTLPVVALEDDTVVGIQPQYEENVIIVQYKPDVAPHGQYAHEALPIQSGAFTESPPDTPLNNVNAAQPIGNGEFWKITIDNDKTVEEVLATLAEDESILSAEPNTIRRITATPNDDEFDLQWYLNANSNGHIAAEESWDTQTGDSNVVVAIIDTGIDIDHPDIADNVWMNTQEIADNGKDDDKNGYIDDLYGYDFIQGDGNPSPTPNGQNDDGFAGTDTGTTHGTHVSGIIGAVGNNGIGVSGVVWDISLMGVRVLDDEGAGSDTTIVEGIEYAVDNGADIINLSLGGFGSTAVLQAGIEYAIDHGVLVVAAAGNEGANINKNPFYPICYDGVLGVSSVGQKGAVSSFSNYGENCVDVAAPGESIYSTLYTNDPSVGFDTDYGYMSGTSMATPVVAGVAALIKSELGGLSRTQMIDIITSTTDTLDIDSEYGSGRVNAAAAVQGIGAIENPTAPGKISAYSGSKKKKKFTDGARYTDTQPYFTWKSATDEDGIAGYYLYFGTDSTAKPEIKGSFQTERTFYPKKERSGNDKTYYLRIVAQDTEGHISSDVTSFTYIIDTAVKRPKDFTVRKISDGIKISWNSVTGDHVKQYKVVRTVLNHNGAASAKQKTATRLIGTVKQSTNYYIDRKVIPGFTYRYRIKAVDDLRNSQVSKSVSTTFIPRDRIVVAAGAGGGPMVRIYNTKTQKFEYSWFAFDPSERAGVEVAVGNVDSDLQDEVIVALQKGGNSRVKIFDADGTFIQSFLAYEEDFLGGVRVATGDVDNDGVAEIITAPGSGRSPLIKVFELDGTMKYAFYGLDGQFSGGSHITAINWDGNGREEIVVAADAGGGPTITIHNASSGEVIAQFNAYDAEHFRSGIRLTAAQMKNTDKELLVTVPVGGSPHVLTFADVAGDVQQLHPGFFAFGQLRTQGGTIAAGDFTQDASNRLVVGSGGDQESIVHVYTTTGSVKDMFVPFPGFSGPVNVASGWTIVQ